MEKWEAYTAEGNDYLSMDRWGHDHWSTFAYLETVAVDHRGLINNSKMRCNIRLHREFACDSAYAHTRKAGGALIDASRYPTRLREGTQDRHDDWSCLEDMVAAGLVAADVRVRYPSRVFGSCEARIHLTPAGQEIAAQLRQWKAGGGRFATFVPQVAAAA